MPIIIDTSKFQGTLPVGVDNGNDNNGSNTSTTDTNTSNDNESGSSSEIWDDLKNAEGLGPEIPPQLEGVAGPGVDKGDEEADGEEDEGENEDGEEGEEAGE